jgi:MFS family permease
MDSPSPFGSHPAGPIVEKASWWLEMTGYHWWVLAVATLGWLFDSMDQRLFVLARTPALRELIPGAGEELLISHGGRATAIFILGWATGGLIFGLFGDRWGRARTMMITILLYSLFTGLSALSQTWWDFAVYRFVCGAGIGGEYAAGVALVAETVPARARPYCLGLLQGLAALGQVSGSLVSLAIGPQADYAGIAGWRLLFLVGILPALLVVVIRLGLHEPESWLRAKELARAARRPGGDGDELHRQMGDLREIFGDRRWRRHLLIGMVLGVAGQMGIWGIGFWSPELIRGAQLQQRESAAASQLAQVPAGRTAMVRRVSLTDLAHATTATEAQAQTLLRRWRAEDDRYVGRATVLQDLAGMLGISAFTWLTGRVGRRPAFAVAYLIGLAATVFVFAGLSRGADSYWMMPLLGFGVSSVFGGFAIYFPELFPTRLRSTGIGFCYNVARYLTALGPLTLGKLTLVFGSLGYDMPLRAAAIALATIYLVGLGILPFAPETKDHPLPE